MNAKRRKTLSVIIASLEEMKDQITSLNEKADDPLNAIQEYLDMMTEILQGGEKGGMAQAAIDALEAAQSAMDEVEIALDSAIDALTTASE
jgi:hypothetical protein